MQVGVLSILPLRFILDLLITPFLLCSIKLALLLPPALDTLHYH